MRGYFGRGIIIAVIIFVGIFVAKMIFYPSWFAGGIILSFWQLAPEGYEFIFQLVLTPVLLLVFIFLLGFLANTGMVSAIVRYLTPTKGGTFFKLIERLFEKKTGIKALCYVKAKSPFGGKYIGAVINEYVDESGGVYCTIYFPTAASVFSGFLSVDVLKSDLELLEGFEFTDFLMFYTSFGLNDAFHS